MDRPSLMGALGNRQVQLPEWAMTAVLGQSAKQALLCGSCLCRPSAADVVGLGALGVRGLARSQELGDDKGEKRHGRAHWPPRPPSHSCPQQPSYPPSRSVRIDHAHRLSLESSRARDPGNDPSSATLQVQTSPPPTRPSLEVGPLC